MPLVKIELKLDSGQFESKAGDVEGVAIKGGAAFDSFTGKVTAFSFAFNQISQVASKVADAIAVPIGKFAELQSGMANVATLGVDNIQSLTAEVVAMSGEISVPLSGLTEGLYQVVSAGVGAADQMEVLRDTARAAKGGGAELTAVLGLQSSVLKAFGKSWEENNAILDQAFATVRLGQTNMSQLAASAPQVTGQFNALNFSTEQLFGSFATLTGVSGNTTQVATQLRAVTTGLLTPTKDLTDLVKQHGFETVEAAAHSKGWIGIIDILKEATGGSAAKMAKFFGSVEAVNALLPLTTTLYDTLIDKTNQVADAQGEANKAFDIQAKTINEQVQLLKNRWDVQLIKVVSTQSSFINSLLDMAIAFTDVRSESAQLADSLKGLKKEQDDLNSLKQLISRYNELSKNTKRSAVEQSKLEKIVKTLSERYPTAVTEVDEYGKAMAINAGKVESMLATQLALNEAMLEREKIKILGELRSALDDIIDRKSNLDELNKTLDELKSLGSPLDQPGFLGTFVKVFETEEQLKSFGAQLEATNENLNDKIIPVLGKLFDLGADRNELRKELGLTVEQFDFLILRMEKLNEVVEKPINKPELGTDGGSIDDLPMISARINPIFDFAAPLKEVKIPFVFGDKAEFKKDQGFVDLLDMQLAAMEISDDEYFQKKRDKLAEMVAFARDKFGEESDEYLLTKQEQIELDQDYNDKKRELEEAGLQAIFSNFQSITQGAQGKNETLFIVGKAAASAEALVNTYSAANKALAAFSPPLSFILAATTVASGLVNVAKINSTKFEKRFRGGFLGDEIRTLTAGNFGDGENRLIVANNKEYIVNADATENNRAILDAINSGQNFAPAGFRSGGNVGAAVSSGSTGVDLASEFASFKKDMVNAIESINIVVKSALSGQEFLREEFPKFTRDENDRTVF